MPDRLLLENQICFPFYAASRLITRLYQPLLEKLDITYPQYLVLLALWEQDGVPVQVLSELLILKTNTLSPLLKRLESRGLITREREKEDERVVRIRLTDSGRSLREDAAEIPECLVKEIDYPEEEVGELHRNVRKFLRALRNPPAGS